MRLNKPRKGNSPGLPSATSLNRAGSIMASLLVPMADAELLDPELSRLEARAEREARKRAEETWHLGALRVMAAKHDADAMSVRRLMASMTKSPEIEAAKACEQRFTDIWRKEIMRQMMVPAVHRRHIEWKRDHIKCLKVWPYSDHVQKLEVLIEAEALRK